jgi:predicted GIY-YIG superfamily endonuclease
MVFESHEDRETALPPEKQIKGWKRDWKINLMEIAKPALERPL